MFQIQKWLFSQFASQKFPKEWIFPIKQTWTNYLNVPFPFSVFFREQYVSFPENKVKEIGNKILSILLLFLNSNYVVWLIFFLMNLFIALKGTHFWFLFAFTVAGIVQCGGRKTSPRTSTIVQFIFYFGPLRSAWIFWEIRNKWNLAVSTTYLIPPANNRSKKNPMKALGRTDFTKYALSTIIYLRVRFTCF